MPPFEKKGFAVSVLFMVIIGTIALEHGCKLVNKSFILTNVKDTMYAPVKCSS
jgi:hypothetical protein